MLLRQGIKDVKTKSKKIPPKLDELKKMFVQNLIKSGYVTLGEKGRTILTDDGKKYLDAQTKNAAVRVELAKLKNLNIAKVWKGKLNEIRKKERESRKYSQ